MASKKKQEEARQDAPQDEQKNVAGKKSAKTDSGKEAAVENDTGERKTTRKEKGEKTPTLSEQYKSLKEKHPDAMLLFRSGDFYHTLNEDAKKASDILGITLTKPRAKSQGEFMASFPYHALDTYLPKLIRAGERVAICDQLEAPKQTAKRGISELVSPGVASEKEAKAEPEKHQAFHR
jgi:DNA mismatch repair ATPase MutS